MAQSGAKTVIVEHNTMGAKFRDGKITEKEWEAFKLDWKARMKPALNNVVKLRVYKATLEVG